MGVLPRVDHTGECLQPLPAPVGGDRFARDAPLEASIDPALAIHLVINNGSSHRSKPTKNWVAEHSRFVVHHTPVHAWWLNQVEAFFSILTRKVLRRGEFDSHDDLVAKMLAFIEHRNQTAHRSTRSTTPKAA